MTEWEAKYKSITSLVCPRHVAAAELLVSKSITLSQASNQSLGDVLDSMFFAARKLSLIDAEKEKK